jgi:two-component system response regulator PilR (NtrC family)
MRESNPRSYAPISDDDLRQTFIDAGFVTSSVRMLPLLQRARKAAFVSDIPLLLEGETGTGKQVLAQAIHRLDPKRSQFPFVTVHCSTIQESLAESELFGHRRGSFSGAVEERLGLFRSAQHGVVFLDDVNDLPVPLQSKLLDVLQRSIVRSVGSDRETPVDVRVIAACNQPLETLVEKHAFRADLFFRLNVVKLVLPPLRERPEEFEALLLAFADRHRDIYGPIESIDGDLLAHLQSLSFAGNIRELEHMVQRMLFAKTSGRTLDLEDCNIHAGPQNGNMPDTLRTVAIALWSAIQRQESSYDEALQSVERCVLEKAMTSGQRTRRELAGLLRISERNLYQKLRFHRLVRTPAREEERDSAKTCSQSADTRSAPRPSTRPANQLFH